MKFALKYLGFRLIKKDSVSLFIQRNVIEFMRIVDSVNAKASARGKLNPYNGSSKSLLQ